MQLQLQFIIHFLPVPLGYYIYTLAFRLLLRVVYALPTVQNTSTSKCRLLYHGYKAVTNDSWRKCRLLHHKWLLGRQPRCAQDSALAPDRRGRKGSNIVGPYIPYDLLQTKGETCAKFGWDRCRNVDLHKVQTNKQTNLQTNKLTNKQTNIHLYI